MDKTPLTPLDAHDEIMKSTIEILSSQDRLKSMCHLRWRGEPIPSQSAVKEIIDLCRTLIFPGFFGDSEVTRHTITYHTGSWLGRLHLLLSEQIAAGLVYAGDCHTKPDTDSLHNRGRAKADEFIATLPALRRYLEEDVNAIYAGDPAATSTEEVIYCYPAVRAITNHRIAHRLIELGVPVIPRMISEQAHSETGIDIHPAATIGRSFMIDHGTGVVVGATARIGDNVRIYQGVTLGARSFDLDADGNPIKGVARHPIIGNNVIIYSNSTILGRVTIGDGAVIGGNLWVTTDVAPGEKLVQAKADNIVRFKQ